MAKLGSINKYSIEYPLGEGADAVVYLAKDTELNKQHPNHYIALKVWKKELTAESYQSIQREFQIMQAIAQNSNVVQCLGHDYGYYGETKEGKTKCVGFIAQELCQKKSLADIIIETGRFGEAGARVIMNRLLTGLQSLHAQGIAHRDVKLNNILVGRDLSIKIADFGHAGYISEEMLHDVVGTPNYSAPEIEEHEQYWGQDVDIFSAGVTLFSLVFGTYPFDKATFDDPMYNMFALNTLAFWKSHLANMGPNFTISIELINLITSMIQYDPLLRPSI